MIGKEGNNLPHDSYVLVKPGNEWVIDDIIGIIKDAGLKIGSAEPLKIDRKKAEEIYQQHEGKAFYDPLVGLTQCIHAPDSPEAYSRELRILGLL